MNYTMKKETYKKTESGKGWKTRPESVKTELLQQWNYDIFVDSISFWRNWGSCKAYRENGLVKKLIQLDPWGTEKIIYHITPVTD